MPLVVRPITSSADRTAFVELAYELNRRDPHWVPPLRTEVHGLIDPGENPWFGHAEAQLFLAGRDGRAVGRISAQIDALVLEHMGAGTGQWGMIEAADEEAAHALIEAAEAWLRGKGMTRALGPFSLSIWDEPGLLIEGHGQPPKVMMGHHDPAYEGWVERAGYAGVKDLLTYEIDIDKPFPPLVQRIVAAGEKNTHIRIRHAVKKRFDEEAAVVLGIFNDAWSDNWGYVPLTDAEIAYAGKKLKPIVIEELVLIAEYDGGEGFEPVAFMIGLPDVNEFIRDLDGRLFPFGWAKLLWRIRRMRFKGGRVPLMGVVKRLHASRLASLLAFMMIERIRRLGSERYNVARGEIGWVLEDNAPMKAIAEAVGGRVNRVYRIYGKAL
jgi:hypothetical protein